MKEDNYKPKKPIQRQHSEDAIISDLDGNEINVSAILRWAVTGGLMTLAYFIMKKHSMKDFFALKEVKNDKN